MMCVYYIVKKLQIIHIPNIILKHLEFCSVVCNLKCIVDSRQYLKNFKLLTILDTLILILLVLIFLVTREKNISYML